MKNPSDSIGNRTRDLPPYSAVPQPTALPLTAELPSINRKMVEFPETFATLCVGYFVAAKDWNTETEMSSVSHDLRAYNADLICAKGDEIKG
jgi:hypothetical protein